MLRYRRWVVLVPLVWAGFGLAQDTAKKDGPKPDDVEVRFADGSTVRMNILQENLEIQTKYGKLVVPVNEMRRIEFGIHLSDETVKRTEDALKQLGSEVFQTRENAAKELVALGSSAYPAVVKAAKGPNEPEVTQRLQMILKQMRAKIPAKELRLKHNDTIRTAEFTVAGRITTQAIKAQTKHFGELSMKIGELRAINWLAGTGETLVQIDAIKHGVQLNQWMDTNFTVEAETPMLITVTGEVDLLNDGTGQFITGPRGARNVGGRGGQHLPGALLGRIGTNGPTFLVGERYEATPTTEGKLYLCIVPGPWNNQVSGGYKCKIVTGPNALDR
jgi:hypothetical protein